jgi:hypothetical protein
MTDPAAAVNIARSQKVERAETNDAGTTTGMDIAMVDVPRCSGTTNLLNRPPIMRLRTP